MNPDLAMGEELLKNTGAGNLFMVFGEPDVTIIRKDGKIVVEIKSFFVRHAYFTGAGEPYDKLKRALRADIDEAAWASLYATRSRPFDPPEKGKVAIKVINHYGDEVLKVIDVGQARLL